MRKDSEASQCGLHFYLCHFPAVCPWASYLGSQASSSVEWGSITVPTADIINKHQCSNLYKGVDRVWHLIRILKMEKHVQEVFDKYFRRIMKD